MLKLTKKGDKYWLFEDSEIGLFSPSKFTINLELNEIVIVYENGLKSKRYNVIDCEIYDLGSLVPFTTSSGNDFMAKLEELNCPCFQKNENVYNISGGAWGDITGTLSDQTDLQSALDSKLDKVSTAGVERAYIINPDGSQDVKETSEFGKSRVYTQHPTARYALNSDLTWKGYQDDVFFFTTFPTISYGTGTEPTLTVISTSQGIVSSEDTKILKSLEFNIYNATDFEIEIAIYKSDYDFTADSTAYNVRKIHGSSLVVTSGSKHKTTKIIKTITDYNDTPLGMISKWTIYFKNISGGNYLRYYVDWKFD